jgi:hypothetical protein
MEVYRQYKVISKKTNDNPTKKATETKKMTEAKETSDTSLKKSPKKNNVESSVKINPEILQI